MDIDLESCEEVENPMRYGNVSKTKAYQGFNNPWYAFYMCD